MHFVILYLTKKVPVVCFYSDENHMHESAQDGIVAFDLYDFLSHEFHTTIEGLFFPTKVRYGLHWAHVP